MERTRVKILLVEDNVATGKMYLTYLRRVGYQVDFAEDGERALELMRVGGYDLVLLDVRLPKLDGVGVLKELKREESKKKNGPVVMLTNLTNEELVQQAIGLGAMSYMDKSNLNPDELASRVAQVLGFPHENSG